MHDLLKIKDFNSADITISANGMADTPNVDISITDYYPLGIILQFCRNSASGGGNYSTTNIYSYYFSSTSNYVMFQVKNYSNAQAKVFVGFRILYIKNKLI